MARKVKCCEEYFSYRIKNTVYMKQNHTFNLRLTVLSYDVPLTVLS